MKRSKTGPRSGKHDLKSWKELEVFSLEMRRLRRNIFLVREKKWTKRQPVSPSPCQHRKESKTKI